MKRTSGKKDDIKDRFHPSFQAVDKPLDYIKMGSQGRSPRQGLGAVAPVKSPFPGERGQGDRDSKLDVCFKNRFFLQAVAVELSTAFFYSPTDKTHLSVVLHSKRKNSGGTIYDVRLFFREHKRAL